MRPLPEYLHAVVLRGFGYFSMLSGFSLQAVGVVFLALGRVDNGVGIAIVAIGAAEIAMVGVVDVLLLKGRGRR